VASEWRELTESHGLAGVLCGYLATERIVVCKAVVDSI
jgi:hypothetical protein